MVNDIEKSNESSNTNTKQQKHLLEETPPYKDHMKQLKPEKQSDESNSKSNQTNSKNSVDNTDRRQIASGEKSSIYIVKQSSNETNTQIESEYFDIYEKFAQSHNELKKDFDLELAMSGFSVDLALIDATHGKNYENGNEKQRSALLENYKVLHSRLNNPGASQEEKQLISEYFEQMNGNALKFLESHYISEQEKQNNPDNNKKREKFNNLLKEARENIKNAGKQLLNDSINLDKALSQIKELIEKRSMDIDLLQTELNNLLKTNELLFSSYNHFTSQVFDYEMTIIQGQEFLSEEEFESNQQQVNNYTETASTVSKKLNNIDNYIAQIHKYISKVEEILTDLHKK